MEAEQFTLYSISEYLEQEKQSEVRHEYLAGTIHAMSGAFRRHNQIALSIALLLRRALGGGPCEVYMEGVKLHLKTEVSDFFYYPDVMVGCDPHDNHEFYLENPAIIFEVASPTTESTDRREKLIAYQTLDSLQHYLIVSQDTMKVEWLRRAEDRWEVLTLTRDGDTVTFPEHGIAMTIGDVYEGLTFEEGERGETR